MGLLAPLFVLLLLTASPSAFARAKADCGCGKTVDAGKSLNTFPSGLEDARVAAAERFSPTETRALAVADDALRPVETTPASPASLWAETRQRFTASGTGGADRIEFPPVAPRGMGIVVDERTLAGIATTSLVRRPGAFGPSVPAPALLDYVVTHLRHGPLQHLRYDEKTARLAPAPGTATRWRLGADGSGSVTVVAGTGAAAETLFSLRDRYPRDGTGRFWDVVVPLSQPLAQFDERFAPELGWHAVVTLEIEEGGSVRLVAIRPARHGDEAFEERIDSLAANPRRKALEARLASVETKLVESTGEEISGVHPTLASETEPSIGAPFFRAVEEISGHRGSEWPLLLAFPLLALLLFQLGSAIASMSNLQNPRFIAAILGAALPVLAAILWWKPGKLEAVGPFFTAGTSAIAAQPPAPMMTASSHEARLVALQAERVALREAIARLPAPPPTDADPIARLGRWEPASENGALVLAELEPDLPPSEAVALRRVVAAAEFHGIEERIADDLDLLRRDYDSTRLKALETRVAHLVAQSVPRHPSLPLPLPTPR